MPIQIGAPDEHALSSQVTLVEPMGSATVLYVPVGDQLITVETDKESRFEAGTAIGLTLPPERVHVFDAASENSMRQR